MVTRFKTFIQMLMAVLALGVSSPQPACAAGASGVGMACCCTSSPVCKCNADKLGKQSCAVVKFQVLDKEMPARRTLAPGTETDFLIFWGPPTTIEYPAVVFIIPRRDLYASPPFGGAPPQAMLRLWLI